jgi:bifunctional non-homologous end joining protein LigD
MIWDEGLYGVEGAENKKQVEDKVIKGLHEGHLEIDLLGEKLKGKFVLQRFSKDEDKNWLLIKKKDPESKTTDVTKKNKSVRSGRTIKQIFSDEE